MEKIPILILTGPTAVGKTSLSIKLAKKLNAEIVSADSMQIYKKMDIGSAKVKEEEMQGVKHHLIDVVEPDEEFTVSRFFDMAKDTILKIHSKSKLALITGGTGLYLNSLIYEMNFGDANSNQEIRDELNKIYQERGGGYLFEMLKNLDPDSANRIHPNNIKRVMRAIEINKMGGSMGDFSTDLEKSKLFDPKIFILNRDRQILYDRINLRVDIMLKEGLIDEVKNLSDLGYGRELTSMKAIGYKEVLDFFDDKIDLDTAVEKIKKGSRNYAKRQITWFKRYEDATWIDLDNNSEDDIINNIVKFYK